MIFHIPVENYLNMITEKLLVTEMTSDFMARWLMQFNRKTSREIFRYFSTMLPTEIQTKYLLSKEPYKKLEV